MKWKPNFFNFQTDIGITLRNRQYTIPSSRAIKVKQVSILVICGCNGASPFPLVDKKKWRADLFWSGAEGD
jgi:hypothetical protein